MNIIRIDEIVNDVGDMLARETANEGQFLAALEAVVNELAEQVRALRGEIPEVASGVYNEEAGA